MFEQNIQKGLFSSTTEKTFIDKILGKQDVESVRSIIKKKHLCREDMLEILYLLSSSETKLLNYSEWDRYIMAKYFVWIREFVAVAEQIYDYEDDLIKNSNFCNCGGWISVKIDKIKKCECEIPNPKVKVSNRTRQLFENNKRLMEHNVKFLVDLYFNLARTTLSKGATGFLEILKNKYEISYPNASELSTPTETAKKGIFGIRR